MEIGRILRLPLQKVKSPSGSCLLSNRSRDGAKRTPPLFGFREKKKLVSHLIDETYCSTINFSRCLP